MVLRERYVHRNGLGYNGLLRYDERMRKGEKMSEKQKRKISSAHKAFGENHWTKRLSVRKKISDANKGQPAWNKGKPAPWAKGRGFKKGHIPWNKGKHPKCYQKENHHNWKGGITSKEVRAGRPKPPACEICGRTGKICFDHDHRNGKFRGWICWGCNVALGHVDDSEVILGKMIEYLEKNR